MKDDKKKTNITEEEEAEDPRLEKKVSRKELDKVMKELAKRDEELAKMTSDCEHWKNEYYKAYADTQNLRKSLEADTREALRYRSIGFLENLIPALNAFHMALDTPAPTKEAQNYQIGFTYIYNQLFQALESEGVKEISPNVGDKFDMANMHAVETEIREDLEPGTITKVCAKGYRLHDRLVTAAMVVVSAQPKKEEVKQPEEEVNPSEA